MGKLAKNIDNTHFLSISSCLVVQSSILGRVSFQHTFLGNLEQCLYCLPLLHSLPQGSIEQANFNYAAECCISLGSHRKRLIQNWVWRLTWVVVVLYSMDTAYNQIINVKVISRSCISLLVMCTKCVITRCATMQSALLRYLSSK